MQQFSLKDYAGAGERQPDNAILGNFVAKATGATIADNEIGDVITNLGATDVVKVNLPAAKVGRIVYGFKAVSDKDFWFTATGGAKINGGTANKSIKNTASESGVIKLVSNGTDWFTFSSVGTWAADNA